MIAMVNLFSPTQSSCFDIKLSIIYFQVIAADLLKRNICCVQNNRNITLLRFVKACQKFIELTDLNHVCQTPQLLIDT